MFWLDTTSSFPVKIIIVKGGRIPLSSFNQLGETLSTTIVFGNFVHKNPYWLTVFGKYFLLVKISSLFLIYYFDELLIFFYITFVDIFSLKFDFFLHPRIL